MNFTSGQEMLLYLKHKRLSILLSGVAVVLIYLSYLFLVPKNFESSAIIYNSNKNKEGAQHLASGDNALQDLRESYTIINWVYSTQLIDHLIKKFDLYNHYGFDTLETDAYSKCFNEISQAISVNLTTYGAVQITVCDENRFSAAAITNEIVGQIDKLNKQKVVENRRYVIREYEFLLKEFSNDVSTQRDTIKRILAELTQLSKTTSLNSQKKEEVMNSLTGASRNYEKLSGDWLTLRKVHLLSLKELEKFNLPNFVIVQYALPELIESPFSLSNLAFAGLLFAFGAWLAIVVLLLHFKFSPDIKFIMNVSASDYFGKKNSKTYSQNDHMFKVDPEITESENIKSFPNKN